MTGYAVVLAVAAGTTLLLTPIVRWLALHFGAVVEPGERRMHAIPVATLGGAAMFVGFLAAISVASRMSQFHEMFRDNSEPFGVVLAAGVMFVVGALDDLRDVSPPAKVAGQVFSASLLALFGVTMFYFRIPFLDVVVLSQDLAPLVTVLWVVLLAQAINLIDGLDGLAAGIVAIGGSALFLFADRLFKAGYLDGSNIAPLIAIIAVGMCVGFLPFNFNPARIIMGDAGALLLGLMLAVPTITIGGRTDVQFSGNTYFFFAPLVIPLVILGVPLVDTVFSFVRRVVRGRSFSVADKDHLHHRLVRLGHGPRRAVMILWAWTALLSGVALLPTYTKQGNAVVPFALAAVVLVLYILFHPGVRGARGRAGRGRHRHPAASLTAEADESGESAESDVSDSEPEDVAVVELAHHRRKHA
ncbi:MAG: UDP-GlcNAc:undecaprenyl-phosphate/decaprenyl-phosphate GlcNAc-phosphate transferase [Actinomycetota bacterium]|jgi:UDP-GlcNAc:undecaprenyl-phosphate GlcNAc-1-phosphate transferase|nr:UDP-GlcNAc:undecaprenyl-phosphate/decaprenyl-phosphate GlcNAc-phosphate transferase [Actinomycetota bacterium]